MSTKTPITTTPEPLVKPLVWMRMRDHKFVSNRIKNDGEGTFQDFTVPLCTIDAYESDRRSNLSRIAELESRLEAMRVSGDAMREWMELDIPGDANLTKHNILAAWDTAKEQPPTPTT